MRRRAEHGEQVLGVVGVVAEHGDRHVDALRGQQLMRAQFVARAQDGVRRVGRVGAHELELAQHCGAIASDRGADARDHRIEAGDRFALVVQAEAVGGDAHVAAQRVEDAYGVTTLATGFDQPPGRIQLAVAGKDGDFHRGRYAARLGHGQSLMTKWPKSVQCRPIARSRQARDVRCDQADCNGPENERARVLRQVRLTPWLHGLNRIDASRALARRSSNAYA